MWIFFYRDRLYLGPVVVTTSVPLTVLEALEAQRSSRLPRPGAVLGPRGRRGGG